MPCDRRPGNEGTHFLGSTLDTGGLPLFQGSRANSLSDRGLMSWLYITISEIPLKVNKVKVLSGSTYSTSASN